MIDNLILKRHNIYGEITRITSFKIYTKVTKKLEIPKIQSIDKQRIIGQAYFN